MDGNRSLKGHIDFFGRVPLPQQMFEDAADAPTLQELLHNLHLKHDFIENTEHYLFLFEIFDVGILSSLSL